MNTLRVAWFLATRQLRRANRFATLLIVVVMTLTFLNLVVIGGILVGLPAGATLSYKEQYAGDVILRTLPNELSIASTDAILRTIGNYPNVVALSHRYVSRGVVEANYRTQVGPGQIPDRATVSITGIDPVKEESVTRMGERLLEGVMLEEGDEEGIMIGKNLLDQYSLGSALLSANTLSQVETGSRVRLTVGSFTQEFTVRGVLGAKTDQVSTRVFIHESVLRRLMQRTDRNVDEIAILLSRESDPSQFAASLKADGLEVYARVETAREAQGTFLEDIERTFEGLSLLIGAIGLMVASITVFIVIFINAVSRQRYIGILKGIGVTAWTIKLSYMMQSIVYATSGILLGVLLVYGVLESYMREHPIDFPFADGILLVPYLDTLLRGGILLVVTVCAGYLPARIIVGRNTLDAILGRS
jgi:putative ABC transport system permease protein